MWLLSGDNVAYTQKNQVDTNAQSRQSTLQLVVENTNGFCFLFTHSYLLSFSKLFLFSGFSLVYLCSKKLQETLIFAYFTGISAGTKATYIFLKGQKWPSIILPVVVFFKKLIHTIAFSFVFPGHINSIICIPLIYKHQIFKHILWTYRCTSLAIL